jgi:TolB-like protein
MMKFKSIFLILVIFIFGTFGFTPNLTAQGKKPVYPTLALLPFSSAGVKEYEAISLSNRLYSELVKTKRFQVVEIEKVEALLKEIAFQQSGIFREEYVAQVGQMLGAQMMVTGSVGKVGNTYTVDVRIINVRNRRVIYAKTSNSTGKIEELLQLMNEIAWEIAHPKSKQQQLTENKGGKKWLWIVGGTALVGGGITALMLLKGNDNGGASEVIGMPPEPPK